MKHEEGTEPEATDDGPRQLDYFAANAPDRRGEGRVGLGWWLLACGWGPFFCGIINWGVTVRSGMADVIRAHANAEFVLGGLGVACTVVAIILFARASQWVGLAAGCLVLLAQLGLGACFAIR